ncbi:hypothetical protein ABI59_17660 [Acidobacteria bacterium Mor1]|nr:hypothetical protein ABI59_17660 [Acidobacteria bacterium Mor1]
MADKPGMSEPRLNLGNFRLQLDPDIESEIRRLQGGVPSIVLRNRLMNPSWRLFQPSQMDWLQMPPPTASTPSVPRGAGPATPRPGQVGDLLGAVWRLPAVQQASSRLLDEVQRQARRGWNRSSPGERGLIVTQAILLGGGALAGVMSNDPARTFVLDFIDGRDIPVPGVSGLSVQLRHDRSGPRPDYGGMLKFDLGRYIF